MRDRKHNAQDLLEQALGAGSVHKSLEGDLMH